MLHSLFVCVSKDKLFTRKSSGITGRKLPLLLAGDDEEQIRAAALRCCFPESSPGGATSRSRLWSRPQTRRSSGCLLLLTPRVYASWRVQGPVQRGRHRDDRILLGDLARSQLLPRSSFAARKHMLGTTENFNLETTSWAASICSMKATVSYRPIGLRDFAREPVRISCFQKDH